MKVSRGLVSGRRAFGDLVISSVDPLADLSGFADQEAAHSVVIQGGGVVVDRR